MTRECKGGIVTPHKHLLESHYEMHESGLVRSLAQCHCEGVYPSGPRGEVYSSKTHFSTYSYAA
jgi:hypothetical protein